jgi:pSer/pThr/pTyr-binding forkhead associated (FHA) protein
MTEKKVIIGHASHGAQGPHIDLPAGFEPLRLRLDAEYATIEIACPVAIVGRHSDADLRFAYPDISRRHCRLAFENGQWHVTDLKSLNGIYVNNVLRQDAALYSGDLLRIGGVKLLVTSGTPLHPDKLRQIADVLPASN